MRYTLSVGADAAGVTMLRSTKMPSKYTSLARLQEIAANNYCGRDGQDYEASYVDMLIAEKADKLSDELIEDYYDEQDAYAEHLAELEAEYFVAMDETLLATSAADTTDGQLPAGAFANWAALVAERAAAVVAAVFHKMPRVLKNLLHSRYTSVTTLCVGNDAEHQGDVPMFLKVGQKIFAGQKWRVTATQLDAHKVYPEINVESYWLDGNRGAQAVLFRQVTKEGNQSAWSITHLGTCKTRNIRDVVIES